MKNLKLESFGIQEMDAKEMKMIDGGNPIVLGAIGIAMGAAGMAAGYYIGKAWYHSTH
ncbi:hypothetical protein ACTJKN_17860 [Pedobacter sp. 22163]|uniref:hypothetical protein n=1 Tax=Pedobacter sp. 22163 TaxID=3453883 RepID=UPI003F84764C